MKIKQSTSLPQEIQQISLHLNERLHSSQLGCVPRVAWTGATLFASKNLLYRFYLGEKKCNKKESVLRIKRCWGQLLL